VKRNTIYSFLEKICRAALTFISLSLVARYLGPHDFGYLNYLLAILTYFQLLGSFGLDQVLIRLFIQEKESHLILFWKSFFFKTLLSLFSFFLYFLFLYLTDNLSFINLFLGFIISSSIFDNNRIYLESHNQHHVVAKLEILYQIVTFFLKVLCIEFNLGINTIYLIFVLDFLVTKILLSIFIFNNVFPIPQFTFKFSDLVYFFKAGGFHCLSTIFTIAYMKADQIMVGEMMGMAELGNYSAAVRVSDAWYFIPVTVSSVFFPLAVTQYEKKQNSFLQLIFDLNTWLSIFVITFALFFSDEIFSALFGEKFVVDQVVITLLFFSGFFISLSVSTAAWLNVKNSRKIFFIRTFLGATFNILLNLYMIPRYGLVGAAIST